MKNKLITLFVALIALIYSSVQPADALTLHGHARINAEQTANIVLPGHAEISSMLGVNTLSYGQVELRPPQGGAAYQIVLDWFTPGTNATVILEGRGSASKTLEVLKADAWFYANNGGGSTEHCKLTMEKRSTACSGGTSSTVTPVPCDSSNTASSTWKSFTANPTAGTLVGVLGGGSTCVGYTAQNYTRIYDPPSSANVVTVKGTGEYVTFSLPGTALYTGEKILLVLTIRER